MSQSVEQIKAESHHLRGNLYEEIYESNDMGVSEPGRQLIKFFGMYQQENRDQRRIRKAAGLPGLYHFMVRIALAGGALTARQYLAIDSLVDAIGQGDFRLTSRQAVQIHGVAKGDLAALVKTLDQFGMTTLAGCGDVERNITSCPAPDPLRDEVQAIARSLAQHLKPRTGAYLELFVEGRRVHEVREPEPLYGDSYLPRKFKTGFAMEGDNCTDIYSDDVGIVVHVQNRQIYEFTILVGGGLGHSHGIARTRPFLAQPLGAIMPHELFAVMDAIVTMQRDYGNRSDRRFARMKYLVDEWGLDAFRRKVEERSHVDLKPPRDLIWQSPSDHLGWHEVDSGSGYLGLYVPGGRMTKPLRSALRAVLRRYPQDLRVTPQQNLLILGLSEEKAHDVEKMLQGSPLKPSAAVSPLRRLSMACVALPTCGLALAEAERVFWELQNALEREWFKLGLGDEPLIVRMTGCPNNCVRAELAEIGFVGCAPGKYHIYIGGSPDGSRLSQKFCERVGFDDLVKTVLPLLRWYVQERDQGQSFGDWAYAQGVDVLSRRWGSETASGLSELLKNSVPSA